MAASTSDQALLTGWLAALKEGNLVPQQPAPRADALAKLMSLCPGFHGRNGRAPHYPGKGTRPRRGAQNETREYAAGPLQQNSSCEAALPACPLPPA